MTSHEAKCVTSETSVSKKQGESLQPRTPEYSKKTKKDHTKSSHSQVTNAKSVTSKTSLSNTFKGGEPLQPRGQNLQPNVLLLVVKSLQERPHQK